MLPVTSPVCVPCAMLILPLTPVPLVIVIPLPAVISLTTHVSVPVLTAIPVAFNASSAAKSFESDKVILPLAVNGLPDTLIPAIGGVIPTLVNPASV